MAARQRVEAAEAEARKQAQVVAEAKAKVEALQQAWIEAAAAVVGSTADLGESGGRPPAGRGGGSGIPATGGGGCGGSSGDG